MVAKQELEKLTAEERSQSQSKSPTPSFVLPDTGFHGGTGDDLSNILFEDEAFSFETATQ